MNIPPSRPIEGRFEYIHKESGLSPHKHVSPSRHKHESPSSHMYESPSGHKRILSSSHKHETPPRQRTEEGAERKRLRPSSEPPPIVNDCKITLTYNNRSLGSIFARSIESNVLELGMEDKLKSGEYVRIIIGQGENIRDCVINMEGVREQLFQDTRNTSNNSSGENQRVTPYEIVEFLKKSQIPNDDEDDELSQIKNHYGQIGIVALERDIKDAEAKIQLFMKQTKITQEESEAIVNFIKSHKYKTLPGYNPQESFHVRRTAVKPPLKCSLVISPAGEGLVLLKGKSDLLSDCLLRAFGHFKSVKTAFDLETGEIVAHSTIDVTAQARQRVATRHNIDFTKQAPTQSQLVEIKLEEQNIIKEIKDECALLELCSGIISGHFSTYKAIPTDPTKVGKRMEESKEIRKDDGHTIFSFSSRRAAGDLKKLRVEFISDPTQLLAGLSDLANSISKLHAQGKVHRDIKLENILGMKLGDMYKIFLGDFGLCTSVENAKGEQKGTIFLLPPEGYKLFLETGQNKTPDPQKADVYAFGLMMFELLTDHRTSVSNQIVDGTKKYMEITAKIRSGELSDQGEIERVKSEYFSLQKESLQNSMSAQFYTTTIVGKLEDLGYPPQIVDLILGMLETTPEKRLSLQNVIAELQKITPDMLEGVGNPPSDDNREEGGSSSSGHVDEFEEDPYKE